MNNDVRILKLKKNALLLVCSDIDGEWSKLCWDIRSINNLVLLCFQA